MGEVFHFTDSLRLPWIIRTQQLRPSLNRVSNVPSTFLWATADMAGDRSCSAQGTASAAEAFRRGLTAKVRLTLPRDEFELWSDVGMLYPEWTPDEVARTEAMGRQRHKETGFANWHIRREALSLSKVIACEYRSVASDRWLPVQDYILQSPVINTGRLGLGAVLLGEWVYQSHRIDLPDTPIAYVPVKRLSAAEFYETALFVAEDEA
jgi:hypothetical protein